MTEVNYEYIKNDDGLTRVVEACRQVPAIALDTEFARFNTYYPIVGLIQIFNGTECFLIDPLSIDDLGILSPLLQDANVLKILHACSEDMEVFQHALGVIPSPVFDTQIASAALGVGFSVGYQALVEHYLSISLPKDQTRSDWLARPLTLGQLDYAALDVIHLLHVYDCQIKALSTTPKLGWVEAEALSLGQDIPTMIPPEDAFKKLKGLWQLNRHQLNVVKSLCAWREVTARDENVPRNRVMDQKALHLIAKENVRVKERLTNVETITSKQFRKYGDEVILLIEAAMDAREDECPPLFARPDAPINNKKLKKLKQVVDQRAEALSVAPELLTKRRHLEQLIRSEDEAGGYSLPLELGGWREAAIGQALLSALAE